jgi:hypothetical protein
VTNVIGPGTPVSLPSPTAVNRYRAFQAEKKKKEELLRKNRHEKMLQEQAEDLAHEKAGTPKKGTSTNHCVVGQLCSLACMYINDVVLTLVNCSSLFYVPMFLFRSSQTSTFHESGCHVQRREISNVGQIQNSA